MKERRFAPAIIMFVCVLFSCSANAAETKTFVCSGEVWNMHTDPSGISWLEVGHGTTQCSIRNLTSENAKRILSICNLKNECSIESEVNIDRLQRSTADGECDSVCVFETDKIISVKKGKTKR